MTLNITLIPGKKFYMTTPKGELIEVVYIGKDGKKAIIGITAPKDYHVGRTDDLPKLSTRKNLEGKV